MQQTLNSAAKTETGLDLYTKVARESSSVVISQYSTSFGWATNLLPEPVRGKIKDIYALVRVADEIVDGSAAAANGAQKINVRKQLDDLEGEVYAAMKVGFSTNLVVHAFALTANEVGITKAIIEPFFTSMRMDITKAKHTPKSFKDYVYGSAEVVGLMCLRAFIAGRESQYSPAEKEALDQGALALGAAFQKINFLRDLKADFKGMGRSYFPGIDLTRFDLESKRKIEDNIDIDFKAGFEGIKQLPHAVRLGMYVAYVYYYALFKKIKNTPPERVMNQRIRIRNRQKLSILAYSYVKHQLKLI